MPKKKTQNIEAQLKTKRMAQLDREIREILSKPVPDVDMSDLFASGNYTSYSPPHTIHGIPYEQALEEKLRLEDENS
jgi:hypothetical protein